MRLSACLVTALLLALPAAAPAQQPKGVPASQIKWKKTVIDRKFRSEGVAIADVNKDGKMDILAGEVWYEAPDWKMHEIRKPPRDYGDGLKGYSESFLCWADDLNRDGWPDLIVIRFPGQPCYWYENPKGQPGPWKEHLIWHSACNETPQYVDLFGNGRRVLVMAWQPKGQERMGQMAWFRPGPDPTQPWEMHPISKPSEPGKEVPGTQQFSHGLGVGDVNGDGRLDVLCTGGWWEQPAQADGQPWPFHPADLGEACADMHCYDVDGDGKADVISSSAHKFGIWLHQQRASEAGEPVFLKQDLFPKLFSETHALHVKDINGDGLPDLITGKRWWSHGRSEPGSDGPAVLYWFEARRGSDKLVQFIPHLIDNDSGIGTQFVVADFNGDGLLDIVTSNKKGVFLFEQVRDSGAPVQFKELPLPAKPGRDNPKDRP
jgi:FG-GAP-like repeat